MWCQCAVSRPSYMHFPGVKGEEHALSDRNNSNNIKERGYTYNLWPLTRAWRIEAAFSHNICEVVVATMILAAQ